MITRRVGRESASSCGLPVRCGKSNQWRKRRGWRTHCCLGRALAFFLPPCLAWGDAPGGESWEERSAHGAGSCSPSQHPPGHCGNSGKMWASGAAIWHQRGLFLRGLMWKRGQDSWSTDPRRPSWEVTWDCSLCKELAGLSLLQPRKLGWLILVGMVKEKESLGTGFTQRYVAPNIKVCSAQEMDTHFPSFIIH